MSDLQTSFAILSAEHVEKVIENRMMRAQIQMLEAKVKELQPPPNGEAVHLEAVK